MEKDLDELLKEAPTLTFDPVPDTKEEIVKVPEQEAAKEIQNVVLTEEARPRRGKHLRGREVGREFL